MVVGDVGRADVTPAFWTAERRLRRDVNATSHAAAELRKKAMSDQFVSEVLRGPKLFAKATA